jgi:hypothetical protein
MYPSSSNIDQLNETPSDPVRLQKLGDGRPPRVLSRKFLLGCQSFSPIYRFY